MCGARSWCTRQIPAYVVVDSALEDVTEGVPVGAFGWNKYRQHSAWKLDAGCSNPTSFVQFSPALEGPPCKLRAGEEWVSLAPPRSSGSDCSRSRRNRSPSTHLYRDPCSPFVISTSLLEDILRDGGTDSFDSVSADKIEERWCAHHHWAIPDC
jgi:hypothetical protein